MAMFGNGFGVDYYEVLQVGPKASSEVIEAAYRRLVRMYHPDAGGSHEAMLLLNEAYRVLSDPDLRREYDSARAAGRRTGSFPSAGSSAESARVVVRPWVRFWARWIDLCCWGLVWGFLSTFLPVSGGPYSRLWDAVLGTLAWVPGEALLLSRWGRTPGKALLRVRVVTGAGGKPSFREALRRAFMVWWRGLGAGFPVVNLIAMGVGYSELVRNKRTPWDAAWGFGVEHGRIGVVRGLLAGLIVGMLALQVYGQAFE